MQPPDQVLGAPGPGAAAPFYADAGGGYPHFHPYADRRKRHPTLRQMAGKQSFTGHCPARLDISPRSACVYGRVRTSKGAALDPGSAGFTGLAVS